MRISVLLLLMFAIKANAQQRPLYSQYMLNQYIINPAYTGMNDYYVASTNYRYQWVGIEDAPRTYALTVHGPGKSGKYGLGGSLYNDVTGPTSKSGMYLSYAYHFQVSELQTVSMGLSGGIMQYKVDGTKVTVFDPGDQVLTNSRLTTLIPDFGWGVYWRQKDKFYLGLSTPQFIQSRISFSDNGIKSPSILTIHYFLNGAYTFDLGDNFDVEPSFLVKYSYPTDMQVDAGARLIYRKFIWLGTVFRTDDAISAIVGFNTPNDQMSFGYSYDLTTTNLANYSFGTHELMVTAKFGKKKAYVSKGADKKSEFELLQLKMEEIELDEMRREENERTKEEKIARIEKDLQKATEKDKDLRGKIRNFREQAKMLGYDSPDHEDYGRRDEYLDAIKELNKNFLKKKALKAELE
ncbi:MAG: type IX secretion system PorP/SprF family membrane protein [Saprospiraceae bacterium]|jgi:type IX secretion system PorP/SprF family membrane protein